MTTIIELATAATAIEGLFLITMRQATDERGTVREFYRESAFEAVSLGPWLQVNVTETVQGGVRGLHAEDMDKLVAVVAGEAFGAYVDTRPASATFGTVVTSTLVPGAQVLVPRGVANGFQATATGATQYLYCFDHEWAPGMAGVACSPVDPALGIDWPLPIDLDDRSRISAKDLAAPPFADARNDP
jgi:dTDP-4-dehydrorhamnose 3,5-epimerase